MNFKEQLKGLGFELKEGYCAIEEKNDEIIATPLDGRPEFKVTKEHKTSLNMISFYPEFFEYIDKKMDEFLQTANLEKDEFLIPTVIADAIADGTTSVTVIETNAKWVGVTYKEDKSNVVEYIKNLVEENKYPNDLWK